MRSGHVALIGWTNVGKSTLLNRMVGAKLAAVADVAQTTRHRIIGVHRSRTAGPDRVRGHARTPSSTKHRMNRGMVGIDRGDRDRRRGRGTGVSMRQGVGAEIGRSGGTGAQDGGPGRPRTQQGRPDPSEDAAPADDGRSHRAVRRLDTIIPVSALSGEGCDGLLAALWEKLPEAPPVFPDEYLTDQPERSLAAEIVREQLLHVTRQELPHATAVTVEQWQERDDGLLEIHAVILRRSGFPEADCHRPRGQRPQGGRHGGPEGDRGAAGTTGRPESVGPCPSAMARQRAGAPGTRAGRLSAVRSPFPALLVCYHRRFRDRR